MSELFFEKLTRTSVDWKERLFVGCLSRLVFGLISRFRYLMWAGDEAHREGFSRLFRRLKVS